MHENSGDLQCRPTRDDSAVKYDLVNCGAELMNCKPTFLWTHDDICFLNTVAEKYKFGCTRKNSDVASFALLVHNKKLKGQSVKFPYSVVVRVERT